MKVIVIGGGPSRNDGSHYGSGAGCDSDAFGEE